MAVNTTDTPAGALARRCPCMPFSDVAKGALFSCNGNIWRKVSTRTAVLHWPAGPEHSFYFGMRDVCHADKLA